MWHRARLHLAHLHADTFFFLFFPFYFFRQRGECGEPLYMRRTEKEIDSKFGPYQKAFRL